MGFKCGIVGLPNVGKSTLFNALTQLEIEAANYPFCTIEPNIGIVPVNDKRLDALTQIVKPEKTIPATVEFVDIAGLVAGASKGEGLGNQFLANIRQTDAIIHVVRCFENDDIAHVNGKISPLDDIEIINTELMLSDLASVEKMLQKVEKNIKAGDKDAKNIQALLEQIKQTLDGGQLINTLHFNDKETGWLNSFQLITAKPVLYVANVSDEGFNNNDHLDKLTDYAQQNDAQCLPICADFEAEICRLTGEDKTLFLTEMGLSESGLDRLILAGYQLLGLRTYFTAGPKEVRAWTIKIGDSAPQAAGKIHGDFERGFIRAETIAFDDFIHYQGEKGAKEAGKLRAEGKDYLVQDGDVIHFLFNV